MTCSFTLSPASVEHASWFVCFIPADVEGMKGGDIRSSDLTREKAEAEGTWGLTIS